ncbi:hypothetical protein MFLAVUS_004098 [Mucor flavus]|uniref:Uncharacterized protein n=1 Tax=Mucor flavus TaxID=439312 RepID=A0ABP9YUY5_9FUNG
MILRQSNKVEETKSLPFSILVDNLIYYEVLLKFKNQYVRYNYTISRFPVNPPELQKFVKDTKIMFAWVRDLVTFAKIID